MPGTKVTVLALSFLHFRHFTTTKHLGKDQVPKTKPTQLILKNKLLILTSQEVKFHYFLVHTIMDGLLITPQQSSFQRRRPHMVFPPAITTIMS